MNIPPVAYNKYIENKKRCEDLREKLEKAEEELKHCTFELMGAFHDMSIVDLDPYKYVVIK